MTLVCLEGPSAVGKTSASAALAERFGGVAIPEVNALFQHPPQENAIWYFERQVERWTMAQEYLQAGRAAVLDGDVFQPLWYNWVYDFVDWEPLEVIAGFYREQIEAGNIAFPYRYFLLCADEATLRFRKASDVGRRRGGFEKHLRLIEPQARYFRSMQESYPGRVEFVPATTVERTVDSIVRSVADHPPTTTEEISLGLFDEIVRWVQRHKAT